MKSFLDPIRFLAAVIYTALIGDTALTLSDWAQRLDPDGTTADIVEVIGRTNEIIEDMLWMPSNQATSHVSTIRTGYPSGTWRMLNYGVASEKSRTVQVTDGMGMLETYSKVDKSLAELNGNTPEFRFQEDKAFIEGMNQSFAETLFYGSASEPQKFVGLAPRYNDTPQSTDELTSTFNIVDAGGASTDNTSIWLVVWGDSTCHGIFPKGGTAGLQNRDLGEDTVLDENGNEYQAYRTHYKWDCGVVVRDWRYVVRVANIDVSDLDTIANTKLLVQWMIQASERINNFGMGRAAFYVNRNIREKLRLGILEKIGSNLTFETVAGKRVMMMDGIPVRRCDALLNTEARVV